ncbi:Protoheme ferro-lyase (ferrochelatase) [Cronobacter sakazakii]|nr:Protoheme ferro-lyase (ferrochelatase) [Cronobacter sakazakii]
MTTVSTLGALTALVVAIVLILRKVPPAYGMLAGALAGGLVGGADLVHTVSLMIEGAQGITNAVMRILAAGVLAGVLIESGAAHTIAETIVRKVGEKRSLLALAIRDAYPDGGRRVYRCGGDHRRAHRPLYRSARGHLAYRYPACHDWRRQSG